MEDFMKQLYSSRVHHHMSTSRIFLSSHTTTNVAFSKLMVTFSSVLPLTQSAKFHAKLQILLSAAD